MMRLAIEQAHRNPAYPFGAVIWHPTTGEVLARGYNRGQENPTWHGEIDAINRCAAQHHEVDWSKLTLTTTAEPCPMCMSAILWAGFSRIVYGTSIPTLVECGYNQIELRAEEVIQRSPFATCELIDGILKQDCDQLFKP